MQRAFVEGPGAIPRIGTVLPAAQHQIEAARAAGALVVFLQNDGGEGEPDQPETAGWELGVTSVPRVRHGVELQLVEARHSSDVEFNMFSTTVDEDRFEARSQRATNVLFEAVANHHSLLGLRADPL